MLFPLCHFSLVECLPAKDVHEVEVAVLTAAGSGALEKQRSVCQCDGMVFEWCVHEVDVLCRVFPSKYKVSKNVGKNYKAEEFLDYFKGKITHYRP